MRIIWANCRICRKREQPNPRSSGIYADLNLESNRSFNNIGIVVNVNVYTIGIESTIILYLSGMLCLLGLGSFIILTILFIIRTKIYLNSYFDTQLRKMFSSMFSFLESPESLKWVRYR